LFWVIYSLLDDGSLRKKAVQALMSYNPFWLHLAIDTVLNRRTFQDDVALESGAVSASDLEAVIREEFLSDTTLLVRNEIYSRFMVNYSSDGLFYFMQ